MFKILNLDQLLSHHFYHKGQDCSYIFKKPIGKSLLFVESDPQHSYSKNELNMGLKQLFTSQEVEIEDGGGRVSVYGYFQGRYNNIKTGINQAKAMGDIWLLLDGIDPFLSSEMRVGAANLKALKHELLNILEQDWQKIAQLRENVAQDRGQQALTPDFPSAGELEKANFSQIDLQEQLSASQKEFAALLEKTYLRNHTIIRKRLKDNILPFLQFMAEEHIESRLLVLAGDVGAGFPKPHCRIEAVTDERSIPPMTDKSLKKASFAKIVQDNGSCIVIMMGGFAKIDGQIIVVRIKIGLPEKLPARRQQRSVMKFLRDPGLYSGIYHGLNAFLGNRSYKIDSSSNIKKELKKKIKILLESPDLLESYKKLLCELGKEDIHFVLTVLTNQRKDLIKDLVLIGIEHYLKKIGGGENFYSDFNFIKSIKSYADDAGVTIGESDWEGVVAEIESLIESSSIDKSLLFNILEDFFEGSPFCAAYRDFAQIGGVSSGAEFLSLSLKIFNHNNWVKLEGDYTAFAPQTKEAIIQFLIQEAQFRLNQPESIQQTKQVKDVLDRLNITPAENDLKPLINTMSGSLIIKESLAEAQVEVAGYFEVLGFFFRNLPQLALYNEFDQIYTAHKRFCDDEYVSVALMVFNSDNWDQSAQLNDQTKAIVKKFIIQQVVKLLPDERNKEKTSQNLKVLEKLGLPLAPEDSQPLIEAIGASPLINQELREVKNGHGMEGYFEILTGFIVDWQLSDYYKKFAGIKMGQPNFSNFDFIGAALDILDHRNWQDGTPNDNVRREIKQLCFDTFLSPKLSRDDKTFNLDLLHNRLRITISEQEKNELGNHVKDRIEGLVDLVDTMEGLVEEAIK